MCSEKRQELHKWIGVVLIILLSIYSGTDFKTVCHEEVVKIYVSKQQMKYSMFGQEKEETLQKLSSRLTSTTPPTSVEQLHCPLLICYPQHPESHQSHLQNRSQWQVQDRFFAPDPPLKFTSSVNISFCIVFGKDDFGTDMLAIAVCNFWMTKGNNNFINLRIADGH